MKNKIINEATAQHNFPQKSSQVKKEKGTITFDALSSNAPLTAELTKRLLNLRYHLRSWELSNLELSREDVRYIAGKHGFFAYKGSRHVAIHENSKTERLVLITANHDDWI